MAKRNNSQVQSNKRLNKDEFLFEIVSPEGLVFEDSVSEVTLPTYNGEITILPQHVSLFTQVGQGEVIVTKGKNRRYFAVLGGFIEVDDNIVRVLSDYAVKAEDIKSAEAKEAKKRAERALEGKKDNQDFVELQKELQKSILELHVADKLKRRRIQN